MRRRYHDDAPRLADLVDDVERVRRSDVYTTALLSRRARARRQASRFADPETLWADLLGRSARRPTFRVVTAGVTTAPGDVTRSARIGDRDLDDLAAPNRVVDAYRNGGTVVLQGLHLTDPALAKLANNLALELDQPVQINAYLTPAAARGLDVHFDFHDVFVVQLAGTKRWRIWEPLERSRNPVVGKHRIAKPTFDELAEQPSFDVTLAAGDVLYLPRGFPHTAETTDEDSSHLTIGVLAVTWHRLVRRAVDAAVAAGQLTSSIPLTTLDPAAGVVGAPAPADLGTLQLDPTSAEVRAWMAGEIWRRQASTRLRPRRAADAIGARAVAVTPGPLLWLTRQGDRAVLGLGDRSIGFPVEAHALLSELLHGGDVIPVDALDGDLDPVSRQVVLDRLVDEGVLTVAGW